MSKHGTDKIPLKSQVLLYQKLKKRVEQWLDNTTVYSLRSRHHFRMLPDFINNNHRPLLASIILYTISKRMPGLIRHEDHQQEGTILADHNHRIKQFYAELNLKTITNSDSRFYFMCVFLTKTTISFLQDTFIDLEIEVHLESQIYIALVHVMLGLEVCPRSYQVNLKKFVQVKRRSTHKKNTFLSSSHYDSIPTMESRSRIKKLGSLAVPLKKLVAKMTIQRKNSPQGQDKNSPLQSFRTTLKQNLAIQILPKLPPKLIKACQFDHITDLNQASKAGDEKRFIFSRNQNNQVITPPDFLRSTQNSAAFEMLLQKNNQQAPNISKTVKISYRPQLMNHKRKNMTLQINSIENDEKSNDINRKCDSARKNWPNIIQHIKQNATSTSKFNFKSKLSDVYHDGIDLPIYREIRPRDQNEGQQSENQKKEQQNKDKNRKSHTTSPAAKVPVGTLTPKPFPMYSFWIEPAQPQKRDINSSASMTSHQFRKLRKQFDTDCEHRKTEANYSMFNIGNGASLSLLRR